MKQQNIAPPEKVAGAILGGIIAYLVIFMCLNGGMHPAIDLTAGEKERGTMETILSSPVSRTHLVLGKFLLVLTASLITAALLVVSMGERTLGLIVDSLRGEEELVIKALDDQSVATDLISGASILGDGRVVLIVNVPAIVDRHSRARCRQRA